MTTQISGDTGITTQVVQAAQGLGGTPTFRAGANASQAVTNGVLTKVLLQTVVFDTGGLFANSRFTPNIAGYYQINGVVRLVTDTGTEQAFAYIYKKGVAYSQGGVNFTIPGATGSKHPAISDLVYLNGTTDYIELFGLVTGGANPRFDYTSAASCSLFSGFLARAA